VPHGLPVGADGGHRGGRHPGLCQQLRHDRGIAARQRIGGQRGAVQLVGAARAVERQQFGAQRRIETAAGMGEYLTRARGVVGEHAIDAVKRGARHQPDVQRPLRGSGKHGVGGDGHGGKEVGMKKAAGAAFFMV